MSNSEETPLAGTHLEEAGTGMAIVERKGFLPIESNWFDRIFISVVLWVALSLFWFRFMEPAGFSIWISNGIAAVIAALVIVRG